MFSSSLCSIKIAIEHPTEIQIRDDHVAKYKSNIGQTLSKIQGLFTIIHCIVQ